VMDYKKLKIFSGIEKIDPEIIENFFNVINFNKTEIIVKQGGVIKELFIILSGRIVSTLKLQGSIDRKHVKYYEGDFFGELSMFGNKPLFDSYIASEDSTLLTIEEKKFLQLIEDKPEFSIKFISNLLSGTIDQFRKSSRFLADVVEWGEKASRRVITDELTGLYNRAFLDDALENFFYISQSNTKPLSFLMIDMDNCRQINELCDHNTGNRVIIEFARIIKGLISRHGIMARYGGDEFCILLPETDQKNAVVLAEDIRKAVETYDFSKFLCGKNIKVTTSIGISSFPETATDLPTFRQKADEFLYRAKNFGRNRVEYTE
jgi:diguanylate cyclase (GGDEF)-like protein